MLYDSLHCNPEALRIQVKFAHLPRSKAPGLQKLPVQSISDKGWFTKDLKLLKHRVMRVSLPNNLALEKQKFIFLRYNFKVTRLNKEYRYCRHNRIKLARRKCISIVGCISMCPTSAVQELEFRKKVWWMGQLWNIAKYCFPSNQQGQTSKWVRTLGVGFLHIYKLKRPFTKCERQFSFWHTLWLENGTFSKRPFQPTELPLQLPHPGTWSCEAPQPGSRQWVKLELRWQDLANRLWLAIKLMLVIKNDFSITHISLHPDMNIPEIFQGQLCTWMSLSPISKTPKWLLFLSLGLEQSCLLKAPGGSHFPITVISRYA